MIVHVRRHGDISRCLIRYDDNVPFKAQSFSCLKDAVVWAASEGFDVLQEGWHIQRRAVDDSWIWTTTPRKEQATQPEREMQDRLRRLIYPDPDSLAALDQTWPFGSHVVAEFNGDGRLDYPTVQSKVVRREGATQLCIQEQDGSWLVLWGSKEEGRRLAMLINEATRGGDESDALA